MTTCLRITTTGIGGILRDHASSPHVTVSRVARTLAALLNIYLVYIIYIYILVVLRIQIGATPNREYVLPTFSLLVSLTTADSISLSLHCILSSACIVPALRSP